MLLRKNTSSKFISFILFLVSVIVHVTPALSLDESRRFNVDVTEIAKNTTVRVSTDPGVGSGVIVAKTDSTYTVLTCEHVVSNSYKNKYTILTSDGLKHSASWLRDTQFAGLDLAIVTFQSSNFYQVVQLSTVKSLPVGTKVYASGFPNWYWLSRDTFQNTRNWDLRAYKLTSGIVSIIASKSLEGGYQLGYTNDVEGGMSGGPVLDEKGHLVGINGRLKYPFQSTSAYRYSDGSVPSIEVARKMETLSWAIPTHNSSIQLKSKLGIR